MDGVFDLCDRVGVGSLDEDGNRLRIGTLLHKRVLLLSLKINKIRTI